MATGTPPAARRPGNRPPGQRPSAAAAPPDPAAAAGTLALVDAGKWLAFLAEYEADFTRVVPDHIKPETFIGMAAALVRGNPKLQTAVQANPGSFVIALRECAALGHMPGMNTYALVPYRNNRDDGPNWTVQGIEQYQGVVERMYRANGITSVHVEVVREKDHSRWRPTEMILPQHDYDDRASETERGPLVAVYAYARMRSGGTSQVVWMTRHDVAKHRAVSKAGDSFWGPAWPEEGPWTPAMWKKTALHQLETYVPTSVAWREHMARAESTVMTGWAGIPVEPVRQPIYHPVASTTPVDAEVVEEPAGPPVQQPNAAGPVTTEPGPAEPTGTGTGWPPVTPPGSGVVPDER